MEKIDYKDDGSGIAAKSLSFWEKNKWRLGKIVRMEMLDGREARKSGNLWPFRITGETGHRICLSGCSAGDWGKGSEGSFLILSEIGVQISKKTIEKSKSFFFQL